MRLNQLVLLFTLAVISAQSGAVVLSRSPSYPVGNGYFYSEMLGDSLPCIFSGSTGCYDREIVIYNISNRALACKTYVKNISKSINLGGSNIQSSDEIAAGSKKVVFVLPDTLSYDSYSVICQEYSAGTSSSDGGTSASNSGDIDLNCDCSVAFNSSKASLAIGKIDNSRSSAAGALTLKLNALTSPYNGGFLGGNTLRTIDLPALTGQSYFPPQSIDIDIAAVTSGEYYIVLALLENGNVIDYATWPTKFSLGSNSNAGAPSGASAGAEVPVGQVAPSPETQGGVVRGIDDWHEPDNTRALVVGEKAMPDDVFYYGTQYDVDVYRIYPTPGFDLAAINLYPKSGSLGVDGLDVDIVLADKDGTVVANSFLSGIANARNIIYQFPTNDVYYIAVLGDNKGSKYALAWSNGASFGNDDGYESNNTLANASNLRSEISLFKNGRRKLILADEDWYSFYLKAGEQLNIYKDHHQFNGDMHISLHDGDGVLLQDSTAPGINAHVELIKYNTATNDGYVYLEVTGNRLARADSAHSYHLYWSALAVSNAESAPAPDESNNSGGSGGALSFSFLSLIGLLVTLFRFKKLLPFVMVFFIASCGGGSNFFGDTILNYFF